MIAFGFALLLAPFLFAFGVLLASFYRQGMEIERAKRTRRTGE